MADWRTAGARIAIERGRRWATQADFARATGLSKRLIEDIEGGRRERYTPGTLGAIERCLGWEPGTCDRLAEGLLPRYELGPELRRVHDAWPNLTDAHRAAVADLAEGLAAD